jgi:hypothetical protein
MVLMSSSQSCATVAQRLGLAVISLHVHVWLRRGSGGNQALRALLVEALELLAALLAVGTLRRR